MAALTRDLSISQRAPALGHSYGLKAKAGARYFRGAFVGMTATKLAVPAGTAGCVALVGLCEANVDNRDSADGEQLVTARKGVFLLPVPGAVPADVGKAVYATDDQTLQLTNAGGELRLGTIDMIDDEGVWVRI